MFSLFLLVQQACCQKPSSGHTCREKNLCACTAHEIYFHIICITFFLDDLLVTFGSFKGALWNLLYQNIISYCCCLLAEWREAPVSYTDLFWSVVGNFDLKQTDLKGKHRVIAFYLPCHLSSWSSVSGTLLSPGNTFCFLFPHQSCRF